MINFDAAVKIAESVYEETKIIRAFDLADSYIFTIDYVDSVRPTPGMPLIRVFKDTGKAAVEADTSVLETATEIRLR